jgi:HAD superfamily hydrolase (TIGR01509 family)
VVSASRIKKLVFIYFLYIIRLKGVFKMKKKLIIFDCYGTLLTSTVSNPHGKFLSAVGLNPRDFRKKLMAEKNIDWLALSSSELDHDFVVECIERLQLELKLELNTIKPYLKDIGNKLDELRKDYTVVLLSNLAQEYAAPIEKYLAKHVDHCFYSFEIGKVKPDQEAFEHVIDWYEDNFEDINPMEVLVVDDNSKNISKCKFMGCHTFLVNNSYSESALSIK